MEGVRAKGIVDRSSEIKEFLKRHGMSFNDIAFFEKALVHSSYVNENPCDGCESNERLEFLGDAVLSLVVSAHLYERLPSTPEGELTKLRASIVNKKALSKVALDMGLGDVILLGKGEKKGGGDKTPSILADCFEAIIGAHYLDSGIDGASRFIFGMLKDGIESAIEGGAADFDFKGSLQEAAQRLYAKAPEYIVTGEEGPSHKRLFTVEVKVNGNVLGSGSALSKKEAERMAAKGALEKLKDETTEKEGA